MRLMKPRQVQGHVLVLTSVVCGMQADGVHLPHAFEDMPPFIYERNPPPMHFTSLAPSQAEAEA